MDFDIFFSWDLMAVFFSEWSFCTLFASHLILRFSFEWVFFALNSKRNSKFPRMVIVVMGTVWFTSFALFHFCWTFSFNSLFPMVFSIRNFLFTKSEFRRFGRVQKFSRLKSKWFRWLHRSLVIKLPSQKATTIPKESKAFDFSISGLKSPRMRLNCWPKSAKTTRIPKNLQNLTSEEQKYEVKSTYRISISSQIYSWYLHRVAVTHKNGSCFLMPKTNKVK